MKSGTPSTLGSKLLTECYVRDTQAMVLQSSFCSSGKNELPSAGVEGELTETATAPNRGTSEDTGTAEQMTKYDVAHYCHHNRLLNLARSTTLIF